MLILVNMLRIFYYNMWISTFGPILTLGLCFVPLQCIPVDSFINFMSSINKFSSSAYLYTLSRPM